MPSDEMCVYHSDVTDSEVEACIDPRPDWYIIYCQTLAEQDSFPEAKSALSAAQRLHNIMSNSVNLEETLPQTNSKRQRVGTKNSASYVYDSAELEAVEAQKVCWSSKYPDTNFMDTVMTPTASTSSPQMPVATSSPITQSNRQTTKEITDSYDKSVTESHSLSERVKSIEGKLDFLKEEMQSLSKLVRQFVSANKSGDVTTLGTGKSSIDNSQLQFPLTTEEEF
ncbi:unnamed protein product, partial [Trichobilharzia szidati]